MISEHEEQSIAAAYKEEGFREGREKGFSEGHEEGIAEGKAINATDTARRMLSKGLDVDFVAECTGLSHEQINQLE